MFDVRIALSPGVDSEAFVRQPALTLLKQGSVSMNIHARMDMMLNPRLDMRDFTNHPEKFASILFDQHVKAKLSKSSLCSNCPKFSISAVSPQRCFAHIEPASPDVHLRIEGVQVACNDPCSAALEGDIARSIYQALTQSGPGYPLPLLQIQSMVRDDLEQLRDGSSFGSLGNRYAASSEGPSIGDSGIDMSIGYSRESDRYGRSVMPDMTSMSFKSSKRSTVLDYLNKSIGRFSDRFRVTESFSEKVTENKGIPLTQVESAW